MAGLGAANELKSHGYDVIILEAGSQVGGRVVTYNSSDTSYVPLDTPASYISGTVGNPITKLAQKYNSTYCQLGMKLLIMMMRV